MNAPADRLRRQVYTLLIAVAAAAATGRILSALRTIDPDQHRPEGAAGDTRAPWPGKNPGGWATFGSNDRSRFDAVRALVDDGTWVIGRRDKTVVIASAPAPLAAGNVLDFVALYAAARQARIDSDRGIFKDDGFSTVDRVLDPTTLEYYSTKPPLLTVLAAGEYWLLKHLFGWSIVADNKSVVRTIVWTFNVPLLIVYLLLLSRLAELWGGSDWGRLFVVAAACFATLLTPFLVTFNNHTVGTCSAVIALYAVVRILEGSASWGWYLLGGFFAGFTASNELPALAYAVGLFLLLLRHRPRRTLAIFLPFALLPGAAMLAANYHELGTWMPAYSELSGPWYQYEGSNWLKIPGAERRGIDFARAQGESYAAYTFHLLLGHHGWFSLTPINLLGVAGMFVGLRRLFASRSSLTPGSGAGESGVVYVSRVMSNPLTPVPSPPSTGARGARTGAPPRLWAEMAAATFLLSAVVIVFYILHESGNYGGVSSGSRWLMWLTPLWLLSMLPVADRLGQSRGGRALAVLLLALSVLSASYPAWNPWRHPWIYNALDAGGLIPY